MLVSSARVCNAFDTHNAPPQMVRMSASCRARSLVNRTLSTSFVGSFRGVCTVDVTFWSIHRPAKSGSLLTLAFTACNASSVARAGSTGRHPPAGAGHGDVKSGEGPGEEYWPSLTFGGSVSVKVWPSNVPVIRYSPHVVLTADSCLRPSQDQPATSGPPHCGGSDNATERQICGPCSLFCRTVAATRKRPA